MPDKVHIRSFRRLGSNNIYAPFGSLRYSGMSAKLLAFNESPSVECEMDCYHNLKDDRTLSKLVRGCSIKLVTLNGKRILCHCIQLLETSTVHVNNLPSSRYIKCDQSPNLDEFIAYLEDKSAVSKSFVLTNDRGFVVSVLEAARNNCVPICTFTALCSNLDEENINACVAFVVTLYAELVADRRVCNYMFNAKAGNRDFVHQFLQYVLAVTIDSSYSNRCKVAYDTTFLPLLCDFVPYAVRTVPRELDQALQKQSLTMIDALKGILFHENSNKSSQTSSAQYNKKCNRQNFKTQHQPRACTALANRAQGLSSSTADDSTIKKCKCQPTFRRFCFYDRYYDRLHHLFCVKRVQCVTDMVRILKDLVFYDVDSVCVQLDTLLANGNDLLQRVGV